MDSPPTRYTSRVLDQKQLSATGYELTLERRGLPFTAGRLITIHGRDLTEDRSYTIASGEPDDTLQVLYRLIPGGMLTQYLVSLKSGDPIAFSGPYGEFVIRNPERHVVFVATGTGVAPCRAYIRTRPKLRLTLIHGVRDEEDLFYRDAFEAYTYHPCISGSPGSEYPPRVTDLLASMPLTESMDFYLCGANEMILDVYDLLREKGIDDARIFSEEYYYRMNA